MPKLLFICSRNEIRSLTAERMFDGSAHYQARSAGTQPQARVKVTEGLLDWADLVFVMEKSHLRRLEERFSEAIAGKPVICLNIPDDYAYMEPALIEEFEGKLPEHLPGWPP